MAIPCYVVVVADEDPRAKNREEDYAAVCALIQNFQLAAWERGLGVAWITDNYISSPGFRDRIGVVPGERIVGLLNVGYPEFIPDVQTRTPAAEKLTVIDSLEGIEPPCMDDFTVDKNNVFFELPPMSRREAIQFAGEKLVGLGYVDKDYIKSMHEKDAHKSTYIGNGVAAPHGSKEAKKKVKQTGVAILHFRQGINYGNEKVYLVFALAMTGENHLQILSRLAEIVADEEYVQKMVCADTVDEFITFFKNAGKAW